MTINNVIWNAYENNIDKIRKLQLQCGTYPIARMLYRHGVSLENCFKVIDKEIKYI